MHKEKYETDFQVGQHNIQRFGLDFHHPVFGTSAITVLAFAFLTLMFQDEASELFKWLRPFLTNNLDWFFLLSGNIFVIMSLVLIFSPLGKIRLGGQDAKPEFGYTGWFAMLFAAGMGIGLMFWSVAEPLSHYGAALGGTAVENGVRTDWAPLSAAANDPAAAARLAMGATIFHWGLHPWAMYATVALALAFFAYNKGLPLTLRSSFYPLLGDKVWGWPGHIIDILAVFATLFGLVTSLGLGTEQALGGFKHLFDWSTGNLARVILITSITLAAIISVVRGLEGGVKRLSEINMVLALLLLLFVFFVGPTSDILNHLFGSAVSYAANILPLSMPFGRDDSNFTAGWTSFYWAWWISWSPFVGMFIARVSKGRTVREFTICVVLIPTLVSIFWMAVFGGTALSMVAAGTGDVLKDAALNLKLFKMLEGLPLASITSFVGIVLVLVFFTTSSDSASLVVDTITAGGKDNAPTQQRVFWCSLEGVVAAVLLIVGGKEALNALQAMAVSTGFPFAIILLVMCVSVLLGLNNSRKAMNESS